MKVKSYVELEKALLSEDDLIVLENSISAPNSIVLKEGKKITSNNDDVLLSFINSDGIALTGDNEISNISVQTSPNKRAIYINSNLENLKQITLKNLSTTGMVQLLTRNNNKNLRVVIDGLDIISADTRAYPERPMKYGVNVYQGALTIYNFNPDEESSIEVYAENISLGRDNAPVIGSGVFISGFNDEVGKVRVEKLTTNDIYTNGMIPTGQPNLISGAIFIVYGAYAKEIISKGLVKTYGTNDMVLDVWGEVDTWTTEDKIISRGPSGIGFVNFGIVHNFKALDDIETFGLGSRGFNQYDGTINNAYFKNIKTIGNGSIGMQFSKPVGKIEIDGDITTKGSIGETLVKGEIKKLNADAISVLDGAVIEELNISGNLITEGEKAAGYHLNGGEVKKLHLKGQVRVDKEKSKEVIIENNGVSDLTDLEKYL